MENKPFNRSEYYSQTQLCREFKLSFKALKQLIEDNNIPVYLRSVEIGYDRGENFNVNARYIMITDWLNVQDKS